MTGLDEKLKAEEVVYRSRWDKLCEQNDVGLTVKKLYTASLGQMPLEKPKTHTEPIK